MIVVNIMPSTKCWALLEPSPPAQGGEVVQIMESFIQLITILTMIPIVS